MLDSLESPPEYPHQFQPETPLDRPPREPLLTLPAALTSYIVLLAVIHGVRMLLLSDNVDDLVIQTFGFIPKRYDSTLLNVQLSRWRRRQDLDVRHLFAVARQSQPHRFQRAVAVAVRQCAGRAASVR